MIGTMNDPVGQVSAQLRGRGINLPRDNEWLTACVECFTSNKPNFTQNQLFDFVFEQWTLADLSDVCAPSLPPGCANCNKMMLTGKYAVQINYFLNVGVPLHKQLQRIRRPYAQKNLEVDSERQEKDRDRFKVDTSARTLKMEITDGVTTVIGFEDQPIPGIKNPIPGEKAVLSGPIEVRKGILMLKPANVTMLGGEVDTLLVKNAPENLLARALGQPENPDPYKLNPALRDETGLTTQQVPVSNQPPAPSQRAPYQPPAPSQRAPPAPHQPAAPSQRAAPAPHPPPAPSHTSLRHLPPATQRTPPATTAIHDAFDDGEDEALAFLAEAIENNSFHQEDSPVSNPSTSNSRTNNPIPENRPQATPARSNTSKTVPSKPATAIQQKPTKQASITTFLSQPKKISSSQFFDISSEIDDDFDEDFELIAAHTASLTEQRATATKSVTQDRHDPETLKKQLEATYATGSNITSAVNSRLGASTAASSNDGKRTSDAFKPFTSTVNPNLRGKPPETSLPNKRKDTAMEYVFGRPKIPRNESTSSSSTVSEAPPFKNPRHALSESELADSEELYDWLPPPPKANLEHVRPSHEKGKILIDYTDSSTLDLDLVSTQKTQRNLNTEPKQAIQPPPEEPFPPKEFPCTRSTLGKVVKVANKLQLRDAKWILSAVVEAKGIEMEMDFSPEALDKIFTVTAEEITRQREQFKTNPELKEKFNGHLRESQKRIQTLKCEMTIHFKNFISKPVVLDVSKND